MRRRQQRSDLLKIMSMSEDANSDHNEEFVSELLIYFLRCYFKWELGTL